MTVKAAKDQPPKRVVFVVYPDIVLLDLVGPLQVFSHAPDLHAHRNGYTCAVLSVDGGLVATNTVVPIPTQSMEDEADQPIHTLVVVGGDGAIPGMSDARLIAGVQSLAKRAERVSSVCSGALILATAGLLDGRRAVTHWEDCEMLANRFPKVRVELDPIFVKDGHVWTSAGITAGIDMALAIVSEDLGRSSALQVARSMVAQMVRSGGQSQYSPALGRQAHDGAGRFDDLHNWMSENLHRELSVDLLATRAGMSPRNFARVYNKSMGVTPAKAVEAIRIEAARELLETTTKSVKQIAARCGFKEEDRMRRAFVRTLKVPPSEYRNTFKPVAPIA